jgi:hypothetical protein
MLKPGLSARNELMATDPKSTGPSVNPADRGSMVGLLKLAILKGLQNTDDMLPARVIAYDRASNRASVQPLIYVITTDNKRVTRASVASVPVLQLGGGGFVLSFPIRPGDLGWIKANDRDISNFKAGYSMAAPQTFRKHTFEDALFIPDVMMKGVSLADSGGVCLQSLDGSVSVVLLDDKVVINAPEVEINGETKITLTSEEIGLIAPNINAGGIRFDTHEHVGVQPGGGQSGQPTNP